MEVGLRGQSTTIPKWPQTVKVQESWTNNEGLFVKADIGGKCLAFLIDTGANVTILSKNFVENAEPSLMSKMSPVNINLVTATGESSPFVGEIKIEILLGTHKYQHNVLIADIHSEGILGMDFLVAHGCDLLLSKNILKVKGEIIQCFHYASNVKTCCRIAIGETIHVPANSEIVTVGCLKDQIFKDSVGLVESTEKFVQKNGLLVARSIINPLNGKIPLRIINVHSTPCTIYKDAVVATCEKIENSDIQKSEFVNNVANGSNVTNKGAQLPSHLEDVFDSCKDGLNEEQKHVFKNLLIKYSNIFSKSAEDIGFTDLVEHTINTNNHPPVRQRPRRIPLAKMKEAEAEIQKMVKQDVIESSMSPWNSNIVLVKKSDGSIRFCIDFRAVNDVTVKDSHPLPRIDDTLDALSGAKFFSTADLRSGYYQIPVKVEDRPKTAFSFPGGGLWQFKRMPMGLSNSAPVFERLMEKVLFGLTWKICLVYLDDIIIFSRSFEEHVENLKEVFERLKEANLKLSPKKCHFFKKQVKFLGHIVSENGVSTDPSKIQAVKDWPVPKNVKEVRSFVGLTSYYRKFISNYADKARPLHKITEKNQKFVWTESCQQSFEELKSALITAPVLAYPSRDDLFILDTDASNVGMGAVLSQVQNGVEKVICYFSKTFSKSERRYCVTRRELLAVVASIKNFHHYLYGKPFKVRSDHGALRWLLNFKNPEGQLARWFEVLASYDFHIEHRAGRSHNNADALSRRPCYEICCPHCTRAEHNFEISSSNTTEISDKKLLTERENFGQNTVGESDRETSDNSLDPVKFERSKCQFQQGDMGLCSTVNLKQCMTCESCRNVQDGHHIQKLTEDSVITSMSPPASKCNKEPITCEPCKNVQGGYIPEKVVDENFSNEEVISKEEGNWNKIVVPPCNFENVRVCTRSKRYDTTGGSQEQSAVSGDQLFKTPNKPEVETENLRDLQIKDKTISQVLKWKEEGCKPSWAEVSHLSPEIKFYWARLDSLIIDNGILYRKWETHNGKQHVLHVVLPLSLRKFVLEQLHNSVTGGHLGLRKTLSKVKQRYFWYQLRKDVKYWCSKCDTCAAKKAPHKKPRAPMCQYLVGAPWERVAIDILGPLPRTNKGNRYLMIVGDYFTKWKEAIPIPDAEAATVAQKFVERIVSIFGVPLQIHTDQGSNFGSRVFKEMCQILGIHKTRTTPFRPKSDGMVEKFNSTVETMLSAFVSKNQRDWDEYVYILMLAYRSAEHESLGTSPCSMMFGREINLPIDLVLGKPLSENFSSGLKTVYAYELSQKLEKIHEFARDKLKLSSDMMKRKYDVGAKLQNFTERSVVWLHNPNRTKGLSPKLQSNWEGPYVVLNKLNDVIYRIQEGPKCKPKVVHQDRLKPYNGENIPEWV